MLQRKHKQDALRDEISELGELLGETISAIAGQDLLELVESIRQLSRARRAGVPNAGAALTNALSSLNHQQLRVVIRAFSVFLDLANLAEDKHRVRILRDRARAAFPEPPGESIPAALATLRESGVSAAEVHDLLDKVRIELVFTAHPTEAKRRSIRNKLRRIRGLLARRDTNGQTPSDEARVDRSIRTELAKLWLTDFIRPWRPTVLQEVKRGLSLKPNLWDIVPQIMEDLRDGLANYFPGEDWDVCPCVSFGSWIGGDRDGHPFVTAETTEQTIFWLRHAALEFHETTCHELFDTLSLSQRQMPVDGRLAAQVSRAIGQWPELQQVLDEIPPNEIFRRWLAVIQWRLSQTVNEGLDNDRISDVYASSCELHADVDLLHQSLASVGVGKHLVHDIRTWLDRIRIFGFHLARLDVRQDSRQYKAVVDEILEKSRLCSEPSTLTEDERQAILEQTYSSPLPLDDAALSTEAQETLSLFRLLNRVVRKFGREALGGHVVSMTHEPSDVLSVLWLWDKANHKDRSTAAESFLAVPVVPLFETIEDLQNATWVMERLFGLRVYREQLARQQNRQVVMLGYSDSTKDGGYLSACWSLDQCQRRLHDLASRLGIELTFFHGRGGSLGRGGGPAARSILSLPRAAFHGSLRLTEQGEVLADRYDDPRIAHRHLEQLVWSSLLAAGLPEDEISAAWHQTMRCWSDHSFKMYRELVEHPGFVEFFRKATPISEIEKLPIGSRPSRRRGGNSLSDLRAIPWVFSWTQSRCLIPAWYGLGSAVEPELDGPAAVDEIRSMYDRWPFFRAAIDNAELALAKTDLDIAKRYAELAGDSAAQAEIAELIAAEFQRTRRAVLAITGHVELLDGIPWLKESIRVRNRYIDPLNFIQVELLRRLHALDSDATEAHQDELRHLTRLTVNGLAAGMRTSG